MIILPSMIEGGKVFPSFLGSKMSFPYPFPGPVALYNNLPINAQYYKPSQFYITAISLGLSPQLQQPKIIIMSLASYVD